MYSSGHLAHVSCRGASPGGFMVSVLASRSSNPGMSLGQEHCVVFPDKTRFTCTLTVRLSSQVYKWVPANSICNAAGNPVMD